MLFCVGTHTKLPDLCVAERWLLRGVARGRVPPFNICRPQGQVWKLEEEQRVSEGARGRRQVFRLLWGVSLAGLVV